jgi:hypothetical protein
MNKVSLGVHTLTKSCSCSSTHTVLRRVGYQVSCLWSEGTRKIWLTLSFSLISVLVDSTFAADQEENHCCFFLKMRNTYQPTHPGTPNHLPWEQNA